MNKTSGPIAVILVVISTMLLSSCSSLWVTTPSTSTGPDMRVAVAIDSLAQSDASSKNKYVIIPGNNGVVEGDLQFIEFANYIDKVLGSKGFVKVSNFNDADVVLILSYGIGDPEKHVSSYSLPMWGQTGVSSSQTYGSVTNSGFYSGTTTYTPTYGVVGYSNHIKEETSYTRFIRMEAYDVSTYLKEKKLKQVWITTASSTGASDDLRTVFPFIAAAMKPYMAINSEKKVSLVIDNKNIDVISLKESGVR